MWQPTHVKVTVKQARNLLTKGKNGTNDCFVVIGIGKDKFQTSVKEKSPSYVEWREECELEIPSHGNKAVVQLTVHHHNAVGLDEFLGQCQLPLADFDIYDKPIYRWYKLRGKPEKDKKKGEKERGELEVMVNFTVKSESILDPNKREKHKSSLSSLKHLGGSLLSIGGKEKTGLKNFAKSVSSRMDKVAKPKRNKKSDADASSPFPSELAASRQRYDEADPGVISDDDDYDDFKFEDDVKVNTHTSSPMSTMSRGSSLFHDQIMDTDGEGGTCDDADSELVFNVGKSSPVPPVIIDETKEARFSHENQYPVHVRKVTSFSDPKPSVTVYSSAPEPVSQTIIEEESPADADYPSSTTLQTHSVVGYAEIASDHDVNYRETANTISARDGSAFTITRTPQFQTFPSEVGNNYPVTNFSRVSRHEIGRSLDNANSQRIKSESPSKRRLDREYGNPLLDKRDDQDSAISVGSNPEAGLSADNSVYKSSSESLSSRSASDARPRTESPLGPEPRVPRKREAGGGRGERRVVSAADCFMDDVSGGESDIVRSLSLSEKRGGGGGKALDPAVSQPSGPDEWERKLYGRSGMTGSTENMSRSESRSSINTSRESSVHEIRRDDSFSRFPEVKALTLDRSVKSCGDPELKKHKKKLKQVAAFKNRFFNGGAAKIEARLDEGRVVEGGNDRVPFSGVSAKTSRLPQEIFDKFSDKTREDLIERIVELEANLADAASHSSELEEYIDNLLLRVMEATPLLLQSPIENARSSKHGLNH